MNWEQRHAFKVGMASILMLIALATLLIWKSGVFLRASGYQLIGEFQNVGGLLNGSEVRYRGYRVGQVSYVAPGPKQIEVHFWLKSHIKVPKGSTLRVVFDGLIGEKYLDIKPNAGESVMLKSGDRMSGYSTASLADFVEVGTQNLEHTKAILASVQEIMVSGNVPQTIQSLIENLNYMSRDLNEAVHNITEQTRTQSLARMIQNLEQMTESLKTIMNAENAQKIDKTLTNIAIFSEDLKNLLTSGSDTGVVKRKSTPIEIFRTLNDMRVRGEISGAYASQESAAYYQADLNLLFGKHFLRFGLGDRWETTKLLNIQQGIQLNDNLTTRIGLFYAYPGFGFDVRLLPRAIVSLEAYNLNRLQFEVMSRWLLLPNWDVLIGLREDPKKWSSYQNYMLGISYRPQ